MIEPFIKEEHNAKVVLTDGFGVVDLDELPKRVWEHKDGYWQLGWGHSIDGNALSVYGGKGTLDFNGMEVGVKKILKKKVIGVGEAGKLLAIIDQIKAP